MVKDICDDEATRRLIEVALEEDLDGTDDITVAALVPESARLQAVMTAKADGVLCGLHIFEQVCATVGGAVSVTLKQDEGAAVTAGSVVLEAEGQARCLLIAERTALNIMQRLSGTATLTRQFVDAVAPLPVAILDTRKTTPGLRHLQKYAVRVGGGDNHRIGLYDQVLIKENHIALMDRGSPAAAVSQCRQRLGPEVCIEVEIEKLADLEGVITAGADIVLLDNMGAEQLREAVAIRGDKPCLLEASGGIDLTTVRAVAESGIDRISVGALTHSVPAFDMSLRCQPV